MSEKTVIKKLEFSKAKAPKVSGRGNVEYCLWVDSKGRLYAEILSNEESGSFTDIAYPIAEYAKYRHSEDAINIKKSFNLKHGIMTDSVNSNDPGFLKAILRHLLPDESKDNAAE